MDFLKLGVFRILANKEPYRMHYIMYLIVNFYFTLSVLELRSCFIRLFFFNLVIF